MSWTSHVWAAAPSYAVHRDGAELVLDSLSAAANPDPSQYESQRQLSGPGSAPPRPQMRTSSSVSSSCTMCVRPHTSEESFLTCSKICHTV